MKAKTTLYQLYTKASLYDGEFKWQAAGMSYLIHTSNNRFIVIDGGLEEDAERLIQKMQTLSNQDKPEVALWILTHPHFDHYGAFVKTGMTKELREQIVVKEFCRQFPNGYVSEETGKTIEEDVAKILEAEKNFECQITIPHTDDVKRVDDVKIRFFCTPEDLQQWKDPNELSLVFQVFGPNKTVMFTGDVYERPLLPVTFLHWDDLKSDICQIAHHGLNGGCYAFYSRVAAKTLLIPITISGDRAVKEGKIGYVPRRFAELDCKECVKSYAGDTAFQI